MIHQLILSSNDQKKKIMKKYPNCNIENWNMIGDRVCDSINNVAECGFDGGNCL